jgi:transcriptional regulator with XRE-family HTH domain
MRIFRGNAMTIAEKINALRGFGYTEQQIASKADISVATVSKLSLGKTIGTARIKARVEKAIDELKLEIIKRAEEL